MSSAPPPVQLIVLALAAGVLLFAGVVFAVGPVGNPTTYEPYALPAALIGLIATPIAYRLFTRLAERDPVRGVIVPLALTEAAALLGLVVYLLGGQIITFVGALMHLVLSGAIWRSIREAGE